MNEPHIADWVETDRIKPSIPPWEEVMCAICGARTWRHQGQLYTDNLEPYNDPHIPNPPNE